MQNPEAAPPTDCGKPLLLLLHQKMVLQNEEIDTYLVKSHSTFKWQNLDFLGT